MDTTNTPSISVSPATRVTHTEASGFLYVPTDQVAAVAQAQKATTEDVLAKLALIVRGAHTDEH